MSDVLTPEQRKLNMSRIRGKDTKPELEVRRLVHKLGFRYRLHQPDLPGKPDLVLTRHHKVILVNGCFWHMHRCRYGRVTPQTNSAFWQQKRESNMARDKRNVSALREMGWQVLIVWECWLKTPGKLEQRIRFFLDGS